MEVLKSRKQILKEERLKRKHQIIKVIFAVSVIFVMLLSFVLFNGYDMEEKFELIGNSKEYLALNSKYYEKGFIFTYNNKKVKKQDINYKIDNNIDNKTLGKYEVNYNIRYHDKSYVLKREVNVVDNEKPVISGIEDEIEVFYCDKDDDLKLDYVAEDNYDGIITDKVSEEIKDDKVILTVSDSSGNTTSKTISIKVSSKPVANIKLNGKDIIYLKIGDKYEEYGAKVVDGCNELELDNEITISGDVDTSVKGEYIITYKSVDEKYGEITKTRKVIVYDEEMPKLIPEEGNKIVYLTFDDGPGKYTNELLDILKKYNVKATFFVTNQFKRFVPIIEREYREGHKVAVHTLTHKWSIYKSVETYIKDFNDMNDIILKYTGEKSKIFRFPGGSSNTISRKYSKGVVSSIASRMNKEGYVYFDWNVDSEDAAHANREKIVTNVINGMKKKSNAVVLMHDIKKNTIAGIEEIIKYGIDNGYEFKTLDEASPTVHHHINN